MFPERLVTDDANDARYIGQTDLRYELRGTRSSWFQSPPLPIGGDVQELQPHQRRCGGLPPLPLPGSHGFPITVSTGATLGRPAGSGASAPHLGQMGTSPGVTWMTSHPHVHGSAAE